MTSFDSFVNERKYLHNVSPQTIRWYYLSRRAWERFQPDFVINARKSGVSAITVNSYGRALNAYFRWAKLDTRIPRLKEEQKILPVFSSSQIALLLKFKPKSHIQRRLHTLVLLLLDTGLRIDEALSIKVEEIDFDNLLITVHGKGGKDRKIPISFELRKSLWKNEKESFNFVFCTAHGNKLMHRNVLREVKNFCKSLGFVPPRRTLHAFRQTFAINYIRRGGSVFHLQRVLGHSTLEMTRRYANLMTEDLQAMHQKVSLLCSND